MNRISDLTRRLWAALLALCLVLALTLPVFAEITDNDRVRIEFKTPQRAVTPGQYAVLYCGERCLGGAVIDEVIK